MLTIIVGSQKRHGSQHRGGNKQYRTEGQEQSLFVFITKTSKNLLYGELAALPLNKCEAHCASRSASRFISSAGAHRRQLCRAACLDGLTNGFHLVVCEQLSVFRRIRRSGFHRRVLPGDIDRSSLCRSMSAPFAPEDFFARPRLCRPQNVGDEHKQAGQHRQRWQCTFRAVLI